MQAAALLVFCAQVSGEQGAGGRAQTSPVFIAALSLPQERNPCSIITYYNRWETHQPQAETRQEPILALNPAGIALRIGA